MGCGPSREEIVAELEAEDERMRRAYEQRQAALAALDKKTLVPHLLVELRSLGFVEIQGKDTGGVYGKLDAWLRTNWGAAPVTHDIGYACSDGACGAPWARKLLARTNHLIQKMSDPMLGLLQPPPARLKKGGSWGGSPTVTYCLRRIKSRLSKD